MRDIQPIPGLGLITTLPTHTLTPRPQPAPPRPPSWDKNPALEVPPTPEVAHTPGPGPIYDIWLLVGISIMLIWPWILFGVVWVKKGIQMNNRDAEFVKEYPHITAFLFTLIANIISIIVTTLFSSAIIRFAQEWVYGQSTRAFHLTLLSGIRHQTWPWMGWQDVKSLSAETTWRFASLVVVCILTFVVSTSSTTSLITPAPFNRTTILTGTELNFSSNDTDCLAWFNAHPRSNNCDWQVSQLHTHNTMKYLADQISLLVL